MKGRHIFTSASAIRPSVSTSTKYMYVYMHSHSEVQTLSDVCLKCTCSLDTSAFGALEVLDNNRTL